MAAEAKEVAAVTDALPTCPTCRRPWRRTMRRCPRCREEKPVEAFSKGDGYCKPCRRAYMRRYFQAYRR